MQHQDDTAGGEVGQNAPLTVASMKMLHCRVSYYPGYVPPPLSFFFFLPFLKVLYSQDDC